MDFERLHPGTPEWTAYIANHQARYRFAATQVPHGSSRRVLDVACGVGYGSQLLAQLTGASIVAVDRDENALAIARREFAHPSVTWQRGECPALDGLGAATFDAIVSLETLEHLAAADLFLNRCRDLLAVDAPLVVSTPNVLVTGRQEGEWSYHHREYTPTEFHATLAAAGFRRIELFGQTLTATGELRRDLRAEMHHVRHNPVVRFGFALQRVVRGHRIPPALPERAEDFAFVPFGSVAECEQLGPGGPFVLMAVARV